jgi:hypothetical protein
MRKEHQPANADMQKWIMGILSVLTVAVITAIPGGIWLTSKFTTEIKMTQQATNEALINHCRESEKCQIAIEKKIDATNLRVDGLQQGLDHVKNELAAHTGKLVSMATKKKNVEVN